jgi:hypothetical protein
VNRLHFIFPLFLASIALAENGVRQWTSSDGKVIEGTIQGLEGDILTLETVRGRFEVPVSRFSEKDQIFAREWATKETEMAAKATETNAEMKIAPTLGAFEGLTLGVWPNMLLRISKSIRSQRSMPPRQAKCLATERKQRSRRTPNSTFTQTLQDQKRLPQ